MRGTLVLRCSALMLVMCARALVAQGAVSGQINLLERVGEQSEDLADAIIWLEPAGATRARTTPMTTTIQLEKRQFSPRVRAVTEGSKVEFPNMDSFSHNVFSKAPDGAFDTGVYPRGRTRDQTFKEAGIFPIYCNIHPRMTGYVMVLKTPLFAQAGQDGRFSVTGVPAGTYVLHAWHDRAAQEKTQTISVTSSGMGVGRLELDARGFRFVQHKNKFGQEYTNASGDRY
jgi:plastocyanin